ncbi:membrane protein FxsA [Bacillus salacetis]|uniref:Membrane protein FxsA n=1 Tax=Bacillus salacetis TaxID=2315464 RepID=A0A3A1QRD1_9BACI|nr:FxsA family protein [Bacillus salacetis]RIW29737.1 membrane protein FxsA [Bacillus salacetis]
MRYMMLFLIIVPALEIGLLILSGQAFGVPATILLIIATGILGAYLAKKQGLQAIRNVQDQIRTGQLPGDVIVDGLSILVGGVLLLTPGFITDALGFTLLFPQTRKMIKPFIYRLFRRWINNGNVIIYR